jgi:ribonuclease HI
LHNSKERTQKECPRIYTDGSCHTRLRLGAWAAILFVEGTKIILSGIEKNTTHQRMELLAVLNALDFLQKDYPNCRQAKIISDSQYVVGLPGRKSGLNAKGFRSQKGTPIRNADLVKKLFHYEEKISITFEKIKAHQNSSDPSTTYNAEADMLCRKRMWEEINIEARGNSGH